MCKSCGNRGRVVKEKRRNQTGEQRILGASGITLLEYVGEEEKPQPFKVRDGDTITVYPFDITQGNRIRFVDGNHAKLLLVMRDDLDRQLFRVVAEYGAGGTFRNTEPEKIAPTPQRREIDTIKLDDLPNGWQPGHKQND